MNNRLVCAQLSPEMQRIIGADLVASDNITPEQHERGQIFAVTDNDMAPELRAGGFVHGYLLNPAEYEQALNKVVVAVRKSDPKQFVIGRVESLYGGKIALTFDNGPDWSLSINLSGIGQLFLTTYALFNPLPL